MSSGDDTTAWLDAARPDDLDAEATHEALRSLLFDAPSSPTPTLGRYRLDAAVGAGGMGVVFRAYDPALERPVAVKLVRASAARAEMLAAEARAQAAVEHPCVVPVHDIGRYGPGDVPAGAAKRWTIPSDGVFIVMRWVEGRTLDAWLRAREPSVSEIVAVFEAIGRGLQHVHDQGLVHQDFKPGNVLIDAADQPHVVDFGIAAAIASGPATPGGPSELPEVRGTPRYMAPEQQAGVPADPRSDQYAFALCWLEALANRRVFPSESKRRREAKANADLSRKAIQATPRWLRGPLRTALAADPQDRHGSIRGLLGAVASRRRRRRWLAGLGGGALALAGAAWALPAESRVDPCADAGMAMRSRWSPQDAAVHPHGAALSGFAQDWVEARKASCRALLQPQTQAAAEGRILCLDRMLSTFEASLGVLADGLPAAESAALVDALPVPAQCARSKMGDLALLLPEDAPGRATARESVFALERAIALGIAGRNDAQLQEAERAHALALKVDHPPLAAATGHRLMWALWESDQPRAALPIGRRALADAERAGDEERVLRLQIDLVGMLGASLRRYDEAIGLAIAVDARCERMPDPRVFRASLRHNVGRTKLVRGDAAGAVPDLQDALALRRATGDRGLGEASNLSLLGSAYMRLNRPQEAYEAFESALVLRRQRQASDHPDIATALNNVGITLQQLGRLEEAQSMFEDALTRFEATRGARSKDSGMVLNNLGVLHYARGNMEAAVATGRRALDAKLASVGPEHPDLGYSWVNLGRALRRQGALQEAEQAFARARTNWSGAFGERHPMLVEPLLGQAEVAADRGEGDLALDLLAQARAQAEAGTIDDPEQRARMLGVQAHVADPSEAAQAAQRALQAWRAIGTSSFDRQEFERWMLDQGYPVASETPVME